MHGHTISYRENLAYLDIVLPQAVISWSSSVEVYEALTEGTRGPVYIDIGILIWKKIASQTWRKRCTKVDSSLYTFKPFYKFPNSLIFNLRFIFCCPFTMISEIVKAILHKSLSKEENDCCIRFNKIFEL